MINQVAKVVVKELKAYGMTVCTVESCTGGAIANAITNVEGSSRVFGYGYVTYSNMAKIDLSSFLGPDDMGDIIKRYGVYSAETAEAMARLGAKRATFGIGITGTLSRKDPANPEGELGVAYIAIASDNWCLMRRLTPTIKVELQSQDRQKSKEECVLAALQLFLDRIS